MSIQTNAAAVRATVSAWQFRTLRVQDSFELIRARTLLEAHEANLYLYSPHAPRLLAGLRAELDSRTTPPPAYCSRSRHTLPENGALKCVVCGCQVRPRGKPQAQAA